VSYSDDLKHPLWQRKRLEVLQSHEFKCEWCEDKEATLHIHHSYYQRGLKPWEYPIESLHPLCKTCHTGAEAGKCVLDAVVGSLPPELLDEVIGYASCLYWFYSSFFLEKPVEIGRYKQRVPHFKDVMAKFFADLQEKVKKEKSGE
jgi:hypothetical protein